ncbi:ribosomal RNA-processing protein RRP4 [Methanothermus fervidus DSM 2088]|uniref:Exosome complex component Rrp4 n=1 Tax=Methanothermus fervidus (strain ATCC 43054 / DSM 2088 / JCM 10308 / V24 S) TaxID=523846 RepID=RRP4_METFV|nr:exosome complex RNA-binding protein Rrp4 [Methanothermus fervidus]E3GZ90.1 RecName: Full=Exosome complex component Rrp4 [Methanothermus fervidus DSM 2088]ADP77622.1 ribosomal RNA-processing protein RRP4 [Methanothermus fervidus DSM 2088]
MLFVKERDIVVPGEKLAGNDYIAGRGTFIEEDKIYSSVVGLVSIKGKRIEVIPLQGKYIPKKNDSVIGKVVDVKFARWIVDIRSPYSAILPVSEVIDKGKKNLEEIFGIGDTLFLKIIEVDEVKKVKLGLHEGGPIKLEGGTLAYITPSKVPRVIGRKGSMIKMLKKLTNCEILLGQNGVIWVKGDKKMEEIVKRALEMIDREAHTSGLTDRVKEFIIRSIE